MFGPSIGAARTLGHATLVVLLCSVVVGSAACGGTSETTDTGGMTATSITTATDGSGGVLSEPMTSLGGETGTSDITGSSGVVEGVDASLVGTWHSDQTGETFEFTADGRLIVTSGGGAVTEMTYTADGSNISYLINGAVVYTGTYAVDGAILSQVDPDIAGTVYFQRVE